jgi:predicted secreted protein
MTGITTQGAQIRVQDSSSSPITYNDIGCVTDFQGPNGSRQVIDTTCLDSTGRQKNMGIPDYGQISLNGILSMETTDMHVGDALSLWTNFKNGTSQVFRVVFPTSPEEYFEFTAYVTNFSYSANTDDVFRFSASLEIDGAPTDSF